MEVPTPLEQALREAATERAAVIGLPACADEGDHRFVLTPEGASQLVERGFRVKMESGAANHIHYSDEAYARCGVEIVDRAEAFGCDIVVYLPVLSAHDVRLMRRGALLLTFLHAGADSAPGWECILRRHIITIALDRVSDAAGQCPFADILADIAGRAAIAIASSLLADAVHGKGILLGGVPGVVPCEVTVIGADLGGISAAASAIGLGATVRIFDNDTYRLREALRQLGPGAIGSALHPRVLVSALRSADIVVATDAAGDIVVDGPTEDLMKSGVLTFDLSDGPSRVFPSMPVVDLDMASPYDCNPTARVRLCYVNAGNAVPRTAAMALTNAMVAMMDDIFVCDGVGNALRLNAGLRAGAVTFLGKCVNVEVANAIGQRPVDINLILQFS